MNAATPAFERVREALIARTGHAYYADKDKLLHARLHERMQALGVATLDAYLALLSSDAGETEWRALEDAITIGETYFFRYADHFEALRKVILPEIIQRKRGEKALRIWSIGCASGAEPYSVAIVLRELLGAAIEDWRISLVGGDISERALAAAREALYGEWALRTLGRPEREHYFVAEGARSWRLKSEYRSMVRFEKQNILQLLSPTSPLQWADFDLILCRNVLIYFSTDDALRLVKALRACLSPGGSLLLGHAEATLTAAPVLPEAEPLPSEFKQALAPPRLEDWRPAPLPASPIIPVTPSIPAVAAVDTPDLEAVRRMADSGAYQEAHALCKALIAREPASATLHYYDAILAQVCDDSASAEAALRRALYLDRNFVLAHHRLGLLLLAAGRDVEGRKAMATAARLAQAQPAHQVLSEGQDVTAGEFAAMVTDQLRALDAAA